MDTLDSLTREGIKNMLRSSVLDIIFTKADGTERAMKCTLNEEFIPARESSVDSATPRKVNAEVCPVWDMESQAWRSFRWDSLKKIAI
jgi:hypothetical protein